MAGGGVGRDGKGTLRGVSGGGGGVGDIVPVGKSPATGSELL